MSAAIKKHYEYKYFVKVQTSKEVEGCSVDFPPNYINGLVLDRHFYHIVDDGVEVYFGEKSKHIVAPPYSVLPIIWSDIVSKTSSIELDIKLISYYDKEGKQKKLFREIFERDQPEEEAKMFVAIYDMLNGQYDKQNYPKIQRGMTIVSNLLKTGGIY